MVMLFSEEGKKLLSEQKLREKFLKKKKVATKAAKLKAGDYEKVEGGFKKIGKVFKKPPTPKPTRLAFYLRGLALGALIGYLVAKR